MLMNSVYMYLDGFVAREDGQDLVEYALVFSVIAFGAVAGMSGLASAINDAFTTVANTLSSSIT